MERYRRSTDKLRMNVNYRAPHREQTPQPQTAATPPCKPALSVQSTWGRSSTGVTQKTVASRSVESVPDLKGAEGYSRGSQSLQVNLEYKAFPQKKPAAPTPVITPATLSIHSTWGRTPSAAAPVTPLSQIIEEQKEETEKQYTPDSNWRLAVPLKRPSHPLGYLSSKDHEMMDSTCNHKHFMKIHTRINNHPDFWYYSDKTFTDWLPEMTLRELAQVARMTSDDGHINNNLTAFKSKLCAFYREIYHRLEKLPANLSLEWFKEIMKPVQQGAYFNDPLMARICQQVNRRFTIDHGLPIATTITVVKIILPMILGGYYEPFFLELAEHYIRNIRSIRIQSFNNILSFVRALCALHASTHFGENDRSRLVHLLDAALQYINGQAKYAAMTKTMTFMHCWCNMYGHYVLNLPTPLPPLPKQHHGVSSLFHNTVEKELKRRLPHIQLQKEVVLPRLNISVDLFLAPNIIIEVDGHFAHHSLELVLDNAAQTDEYQKFRERGRTIIKRKILQHAGYVVFNVIDLKKDTLSTLIPQLQGLVPQPVSHADSPVSIFP